MIELRVDMNGVVEKLDEGGIGNMFSDFDILQVTLLVGIAMEAGKHIEMFNEHVENGDFGVYRFLETSEEEFQLFLDLLESDDANNAKEYLQNGGEL